MIKNEIQLIDSFRKLEETERNLFEKFSQKLRDAHEVRHYLQTYYLIFFSNDKKVERLRQEKTKYLSVIGSIVGACLGIIGTSINYGFKKRDFNRMLNLIETQNSEFNRVTESRLKPLEAEQSQPIPMTSKNSMQTQTEHINEETIVETILNTGSNLEYKMKVNTLATVVLTYALIAVTIPLILRVFDG